MNEDTLAVAILCLAKGKNRMVAEFYDCKPQISFSTGGKSMVSHRLFLTEGRKL